MSEPRSRPAPRADDRRSDRPDVVVPNIVVIVADDVGYGDLGCYNPESRIPTPHIDRLAARGLRFTDAHAAAAVCTPSRYALLTGRYGWRSPLPHGVLYGYEPPLIEPDRPTLASLLGEAGYATAAIGKWHLGLGFSALPGAAVDLGRPLPWPEASRGFEDGIDFAAGVTGGPLELGFDAFFGTAGCPTCQPPYAFIEGDRFPVLPTGYDAAPPFTGRPGRTSPGWRHDRADLAFTDRAVDYLRGRRSDEKPFFLYLAADAPHEPCVEATVPAFARGRSRAGFRGDLVWLFDWMVGRIVAALERTSMLDDTLVIVTSDHGALPGDRVSNDPGGEPPGMAAYRTYGHAASGPWRGSKAHIWEGGHRVPLVASWPGRIPSGGTSDALVCQTDLVATLATLVGVPLPDGAAEDSVDVSNVLFDPPGGPPPRTDMVHHSQKGAFAVRRGRWKAIFGTTGSGGWPPPADGFPAPVVEDPAFPDLAHLARGAAGQLYDLESDPGESHDLWHERFDVVADLAKLLHRRMRDGRSVRTR